MAQRSLRVWVSVNPHSRFLTIRPDWTKKDAQIYAELRDESVARGTLTWDVPKPPKAKKPSRRPRGSVRL